MEEEFHPFLDIGQGIPGSRMIVGTFPVYALTNPRTPEKEMLIQQHNMSNFFYGSHRSNLWNWYQTHVDGGIDPNDVELIISSLIQNGIAISDVISSAIRNNGANDNGLNVLQWNEGLANIIEDRIEKIICTSKSQNGAMGWLSSNVLIPNGFIYKHEESIILQNQILNQIVGAHQDFPVLIARVFKISDRLVQIIGLPSPGSPYRQLHQFGYNRDNDNNVEYLNQYLSTVFNWFIN